MKYPDSLEKLIECFSLYPGIGPKTAERLALYTITKLSKNSALEFGESINNVVNKIHRCERCGVITENEVCSVCLDENRTNELMVVESSKDVIAIEQIGLYQGRYFVLNGVISPMKGIGPDEIGTDKLIKLVKEAKIKNITLALSATVEGETTSLYIKKLLENEDCEIFKIGYGLPVGASLEYIDEITLIKALEGKKKI